ncbi:MAG: DUF2070 family protein, partial [Methanospirillum sp.]
MDDPADVRLANLTRFLFSAPSWRRSMVIAIVLGLAVDVGSYSLGGPIRFFGTLAFTLPTLVAFVLTKPLVELSHSPLNWN